MMNRREKIELASDYRKIGPGPLVFFAFMGIFMIYMGLMVLWDIVSEVVQNILDPSTIEQIENSWVVPVFIVPALLLIGFLMIFFGSALLIKLGRIATLILLGKESLSEILGEKPRRTKVKPRKKKTPFRIHVFVVEIKRIFAETVLLGVGFGMVFSIFGGVIVLFTEPSKVFFGITVFFIYGFLFGSWFSFLFSTLSKQHRKVIHNLVLANVCNIVWVSTLVAILKLVEYTTGQIWFSDSTLSILTTASIFVASFLGLSAQGLNQERREMNLKYTSPKLQTRKQRRIP